ncbi:four-carbon acid sugar kinase family protein [Nakamurella endophytica]|uniref:4-hydroxythreonine-4-phosphate dehydrogenase n=1 Tax=Nakamurella endophytica TaxID=1748367 RepID=A0A917WGJ6_9ACTN|nr:four-carbon acid sugar kinase family protein [Nakamurella endophytica]GGM02418.1 hypothetical protein GCM10011594_23130 [Nakamurella endophytica]
MASVAVLADDLSGAVETAAGFLLRGARVWVELDERCAPGDTAVDVRVVDTDSRSLPADSAAARVTAALRRLPDTPLLVKKIDSLLRGPVAAELAAVRACRPNVVVAPALPAAGRSVRGAVVHLDGVPLDATDAWRAEARPAPGSVPAALSPVATRSLDVDSVRGGELAAELRASLDAGRVPVCDAEHDGDLDLIAAAACRLDRPALVGSAALAAAVARTVPVHRGAPRRGAPVPHRPGVPATLVVVGSAAPSVPAQLAVLRAAGARVLLARPADLLAGHRPVPDPAAGEIVVAAIDPAAPVRPGDSAELAAALATAVVPAARRADGLVLTGGGTARAVLDRLGVDRLRPLTEVHHGAVVCVDPTGRLVATRPGSFGAPDSLLAIARAVRTARTTPAEENP